MAQPSPTPVSGILDAAGKRAYLRVDGYLASKRDVEVPRELINRLALRSGDMIEGAAANGTLTRVDVPAQRRDRVDFEKLTPLFPEEQLRIEAPASRLTGRVIDLIAPLGKGQRALIVAPPQAGKTTVLKHVAAGLAANHPEVHVISLLVDERPEEVTDWQRNVKVNEVAASTFDRSGPDHIAVTEMVAERSKRLAEDGTDVVVLCDSITRMARAYNLAAKSSGRVTSGGVDLTTLEPIKKLFGAARNVEDGASITIVASCLVNTGSRMDDVIYEEFKGRGNMELHLTRELADLGLFPAVDVIASGTRADERLLDPAQADVIYRLRRALAKVPPKQALELLIRELERSPSNDVLLSRYSASA